MYTFLLRYFYCSIGASAAKGYKSAVCSIFCTVVRVTSVYDQRFHNGKLLHF